MKIGFVLDDTLDKTDGVQQYILSLGRYYRRAGHDVHYLVADSERTDIPNIYSLSRYAKFSFNHNNVRTPLPARKKKIKSLLNKLQLDVLHVQLPYSPLMAGRIIKAAPKSTRIIGTFHILPATRFHAFTNKLLSLIIWPTLRRFDHIVAVSEPASKFALSAYGIRSKVIPNCVDITAFKTQLHKNPSKKRIVFLGRFVKRKGPEEMVRAIRELISRVNINSFEVIMAGTGPEWDVIKNLSSSMGLEKIIQFPGFIKESDKPSLLGSADVAVFPSIGGESFGIVLIEAMAAGATVVIGGNNPGYSSVLAPKPELLFDPRNINEFARVLHVMLLRKDRFEIKKWQEEYVKTFDIEIIAKKLLQIYSRPKRTT